MCSNLINPSADQVLNVSALTRLIKSQLEENYARVWVQGEISNLRKQNSGHLYFSLKDSKSQLACVFFAGNASRQSFEIKDGMEVQLLGDISVYEPYGRYQLIVKVAIKSGAGRLQLEFERLKRKLAAEGLFNSENKRSLPTLPGTIALVTSPTGAAVRDFLKILRRRNYRGKVVIFPARVQGKEAAVEIAAMLKEAQTHNCYDLLVITRGGGSIEDLWAFNEESLALAVAKCTIPTISAIGHEIDSVLIDFVADKRAETPSGAAELISSLYLEAVERHKTAERNLEVLIDHYLKEIHNRISNINARIKIIAPERIIQHYFMYVDEIENRLSQKLLRRIANERESINQIDQRIAALHPRTRIGLAKQNVKDATRRMHRSVSLAKASKYAELETLEMRLNNGSLKSTLKRGYAVIENAEGQIIENSQLARKEKQLKARFHDGDIQLNVNES